MRRRWTVLLPALVVLGILSGCAGRGIEVTAVFDDVGDLQARHSVQVADVRVGSVESIRLTDEFKAEVRLALDPDVKVPKASVALLRTTSLLGEKFIELRPIGAEDNPTAATSGPFLQDGDRIERTREAPELEFVAEEAIVVLGAVVADDLATLIDTGADAFGGRGPELRTLIEDLASISATFTARSAEIQQIITNIDAATQPLASNRDDLDSLLVKLAGTTRLLAENRDRLVAALDALSALARSQNTVLTTYHRDIDQQIKQIDQILAVAAGHTTELATLITWLERFVLGAPKTIPGDFAQVYGWIIPASEDPRSPG